MPTLETRRYVQDLGKEVTLREYFGALLEKLWEEGEGFSGKRPFGNSSWEYDIYAFLVQSGEVKGEFDSDGCLLDFDRKAANALAFKLIAEMCAAPSEVK